MRKTTVGWMTAAGLIILSLVLGGCAAGQQAEQAQQAQQTKAAEELLSAAGFKEIFPATPKLKARLQAMPQKRDFYGEPGSEAVYVYASAGAATASMPATSSNTRHISNWRPNTRWLRHATRRPR